MRNTEHRHIGDLVMGNQQALNLRRIHVDAARDNGEVLAVGQVKKTLLVEVTHIAHCAPALLIEGVLGFLWLIKIFKRPAVGEVHIADLARAQHFAVFAENSRLTNDRLAHRTLMSQPIGRIDNGKAVPFTTGVVLHNHRAPPVDHRFFDINGARRRRVDGTLH